MSRTFGHFKRHAREHNGKEKPPCKYGSAEEKARRKARGDARKAREAARRAMKQGGLSQYELSAKTNGGPEAPTVSD